MISDPPEARRDGPSKHTDPGDGHSGEGLDSVRPRLARTLADSAQRTASKQLEAMSSLTPPEPEAPVPPEP